MLDHLHNCQNQDAHHDRVTEHKPVQQVPILPQGLAVDGRGAADSCPLALQAPTQLSTDAQHVQGVRDSVRDRSSIPRPELQTLTLEGPLVRVPCQDSLLRAALLWNRR